VLRQTSRRSRGADWTAVLLDETLATLANEVRWVAQSDRLDLSCLCRVDTPGAFVLSAVTASERDAYFPILRPPGSSEYTVEARIAAHTRRSTRGKPTMLIETRSFLRERAGAEDAMAAATDCGPAAWSHANLAQLYRARCIDTAAGAGECQDCAMGAQCVVIMPTG
jgi:hypothetical protein